jgi:hypothetical protein
MLMMSAIKKGTCENGFVQCEMRMQLWGGGCVCKMFAYEHIGCVNRIFLCV